MYARRKSIYETIDEIIDRQMPPGLKTEAAWEDPDFPESNMKVVLPPDESGAVLCVYCKLRPALQSLHKDLRYGTHYDMYDALRGLGAMEGEDIDWGPVKEIRRGTPELNKTQVHQRFLFLNEIAKRLHDKDVLTQIGMEAPKKKNGTFARNQKMRIAACGLAKWQADVLEIIGEAETDTELEITVRYMRLDEEEIDRIEDDFLMKHWDMLGFGRDGAAGGVTGNRKKPDEKKDPLEAYRRFVQKPFSEERKEHAEEWLEYTKDYVTHDLANLEIEGKAFVLTGIDYEVGEALEENNHVLVRGILQLGGILRSAVSGKTDYLVADPPYAGYTKTNYALELMDKGKGLRIIIAQELAAHIMQILEAKRAK